MKKIYSKPEIIFEDFTLNENIAGDCELKTNTPARGACAYPVPDEFLGTSNIFLSSMVGICTTVEQDGHNGICYHAPTENSNLFNS